MKNFKMVNKNSVGGAGLLLFFIVISQARLFDFLIDTSLGRILLILILICLSYCHGILGVVGVLLIIIAFNHSGLSFMSEGFETSTDCSGSQFGCCPDGTTTKQDSAGTNCGGTPGETIKAEIKLDPDAVAAIKSQMMDKIKNAKESAASNKPTDSTTTTDSFVTTRGLEGFDVLGIENNLKRGKQSNSIPTSSYSIQDSDFISAYEGPSSIFGNFSLF